MLYPAELRGLLAGCLAQAFLPVKVCSMGGWRSLAIVCGLALPSAALAADCPSVGTEAATVAEVIDGDTVRLAEGMIVRLAGIEAPKQPLSAVGAWPPAEDAREALHRLAGGVAIRLAPAGGSLDRYGRRHAYLFRTEGSSVQAEMVASGWARVRWLPEEGACFQMLASKEGTARQARLGLWASPEYAVRQADDPSLLDRNGLYELVEGRVVSVGHGSRMIFLDFGHDYRRDFTVMVSSAIADSLTAAGRSADVFANRRVRVRGVIEESSGPAIRLHDLAEIEILGDGDNVGAPR